jgi:signal transduction histidine kinase
MRRLYLKIYLALIGALLLVAVLGSLLWVALPRSDDDVRMLEGLAASIGELLPPPGAPTEDVQRALVRFSDRFGAHITLRDSGGALIAAAGRPIPPPDARRRRPWQPRWRGREGVAQLPLADGRLLMARPRQRDHAFWHPILPLGVLALGVAIAAYPVVRSISGRVERLRARVDALGSGDLAARVEVEGKDEVADLARSFNRAAERIEQLVGAQRNMLSSASHELRSPLARLRVAVELMAGMEDGAARPELRTRIERDIEELDELIGEILLASRLDAGLDLTRWEEVDLLGLLAEEAARVGAEVSGEPACLQGDARMLRRLVRNLLENARRHGAASTIEARIAAHSGETLCLQVSDRGPGVPETERERIFEPFYRPTGMRESGDGVGLGLSLVRQIARHHGGEARCLAREGGGSTFEVRLPLSGSPPSAGSGSEDDALS